MSKKKTFTVKLENDPYEKIDFLKDCPNYQFTPTILPKQDRIIVMGDIHGDYNLAVQSFKLANLIDDNFRWIAKPKDTVVVQVGDQVDSCRPIPYKYECTEPHDDDTGRDMDVMNFFDRMHNEAVKHGGAVYSLIGNHELMNAQGIFSYVSHENLFNFDYDHMEKDKTTKYKGVEGRKYAFTPGGPIAKHIACTRNSILIIGSNMFAHAGVLPEIVNKLHLIDTDDVTKLKYLNSIVRKWLMQKLTDKNDIDNLNRIFYDSNNLFWTRKLGEIGENAKLDADECAMTVSKTLDVFRVGQIIVGHSPQFIYKGRDGINGTCMDRTGRNRLYRVDNGLSSAFNVFGKHNPVQVLEILNDNEFNILTSKSVQIGEPVDIGISAGNMGPVAKIFAPGRVRK
uniref:Calcineurin-like phosphoesterase domain-containing protein n=1 Tax=viral metagenome TaxID=1070528 RepID=A0A6C0CC36_9ZZZZ